MVLGGAVVGATERGLVGRGRVGCAASLTHTQQELCADTKPQIPHLASLTALILCLSPGSAEGPGWIRGQWCPALAEPDLSIAPSCSVRPGQADRCTDISDLLLRDSVLAT